MAHSIDQNRQPVPSIQLGTIVLAGGRSVRMGVDKAVLRVDGHRMIDRVINVATAAECTPVVVAGRNEIVGSHVRCVNDAVPAAGPLAGMCSGWEALCEGGPIDAVLVLSCDLPRIDGDTIRGLRCLWNEQLTTATPAAAVAAHDGTHRQPLVAIYSAETMDRCVRAFAAGERSIRRVLDPLPVVHFCATSAAVADADEPGDLDAFRVDWPTVPDQRIELD